MWLTIHIRTHLWILVMKLWEKRSRVWTILVITMSRYLLAFWASIHMAIRCGYCRTKITQSICCLLLLAETTIKCIKQRALVFLLVLSCTIAEICLSVAILTARWIIDLLLIWIIGTCSSLYVDIVISINKCIWKTICRWRCNIFTVWWVASADVLLC